MPVRVMRKCKSRGPWMLQLKRKWPLLPRWRCDARAKLHPRRRLLCLCVLLGRCVRWCGARGPGGCFLPFGRGFLLDARAPGMRVPVLARLARSPRGPRFCRRAVHFFLCWSVRRGFASVLRFFVRYGARLPCPLLPVHDRSGACHVRSHLGCAHCTRRPQRWPRPPRKEEQPQPEEPHRNPASVASINNSRRPMARGTHR